MFERYSSTKLLLGLTLVTALLGACKPPPPEVSEIEPQISAVLAGDTVGFSVKASGTDLGFEWTAIRGTITPGRAAAHYIAPDSPGPDTVEVQVTGKGDTTFRSLDFDVVIPTPPPSPVPTATSEPTPTATPTEPPTPTLTPTPMPRILEDFEDARRVNWFSPDPDVFEYRETSEQVYRGSRSCWIKYNKTDTYQYIGADPIEPECDFRGAQALQVWVYGKVTILLKLEDKNLQAVEVGEQNATDPAGWTLLRFDLAGVGDQIDLSRVKMLFFPGPGNASESGVIFFDDIALSY